MKQTHFLMALAMLAIAAVQAQAERPFELADGDRVVFLGGALIERDQTHGYLETLLTTRYPHKNITFRNLGWAGDSVWGWARIGNPASARDGFKTLAAHIAELKPTVVFVCYGMSESFEGESGLAGFVKQYNALLDMLAQNGARIVMLSPNRHENLGPPLPDPTEHNKNLELYIGELKKIAAARRCPFVNIYELMGDGTQSPAKTPFTDNGIHLTPYGGWRLAVVIEQALALPSGERAQLLDLAPSIPTRVVGSKVGVTDIALPFPPLPATSPINSKAETQNSKLQINGLDPGRYVLKIDDTPVASGSAEEWAKGMSIVKGPDFDQLEKLRQLIIEKNTLYFHRWRPQNQTYIFGFRKKEQGRNAVEIPQFDPLVAEKEAEIARLRVPVTRTYTLTKEK